MSTPTILVIGDEGVGKASLIKALVGDARGCVWHLDTKYYTASVLLNAQQLGTPALVHPEALVLLLDASRHDTFLKLREWWKSVCNSGLDSWHVGLVVANKVDLVDGSRPEWLKDVEEWALMEMLEYVEASVTDEVADSLLVDQGVARIRAALEAHIWPGMKLKKRESGLQSQKSVSEVATSENPEGRDGHEALTCPKTADMKGCLLHFDEDEQRAQSSRNADGWVLFSSDEDDEDTRKEENTQDGPLCTPADDLEALGDSFEKLLSDIVGAREKLQHLGDGERREGAARLAMKLASVMDGGDPDCLDSSLAEP